MSTTRVPLPKTYRVSKEEMETVINIDKLADKAVIWSNDRAMITKLKKRCKLVEETKFGCKFEAEKNQISIRTVRGTKETTEDETD